jgi:DNA primase
MKLWPVNTMNKFEFENYVKVTNKAGSQITGHSPFREDENPSFSANLETGLWRDHGTGESGNWFQFCEKLNLFLPRPEKNVNTFWENAELVATYDYFDESSQPQLRVERYENKILGAKQFVQKHLENGKWVKGKNTLPITPYRHSDWKNSLDPLFEVEGEKCVEALVMNGLLATTLPGGVNAKNVESYAKYIKDRPVYILPDNDEVGLKYAEKIANVLSATVKVVKIVRLNGLGPAEDIVDWFKKGGTKEKLIELCEEAPAFKPTNPISVESDDFGPLRALPDLLPSVPTLEEVHIPEAFRPWVLDASECMNVSRDFILIPAFVGLASLIGRRLAVRPKQFAAWDEVSNLWGVIVGPPSVLKTPALSEALSFVTELNSKRIQKFKDELKEAEPKIEMLKIKEKSLASAYKNAIKTGVDEKDIESALNLTKEEIKKLKPKLSRIMVNDTTVEKLCELLIENPNGLLIFRDELSGWLSNLTKDGREGDRELYLESWGGKNPYNVERIIRGSGFIPALRVAIMGGIQPSKLNVFMKDIAKGGSNADGLFDRFQLAVYPERNQSKYVDRVENVEAKQRVSKIFNFLLEHDFNSSSLKKNNDNIPTLKFSNSAQKIFTDWFIQLEARLDHPSVSEIPHFQSHLGKYRSLMPKLAMLFELIAWADVHRYQSVPLVSISDDSARSAIKLCEFLEAHAKKIHAIASEPGLKEAHELSKKIKNGEIKNMTTVRWINRNHWRGLNNVADVEAGLMALERFNWIKIKKVNPGQMGRPSEVVLLHPDLIKA